MEHNGARLQATHSIRGKRVRSPDVAGTSKTRRTHEEKDDAKLDKKDDGMCASTANNPKEGPPQAVQVFFFRGVEYVDSTGLPWGMTQEEFDKRNFKGSNGAGYDSRGLPSGVTHEEFDLNNSNPEIQTIDSWA